METGSDSEEKFVVMEAAVVDMAVKEKKCKAKYIQRQRLLYQIFQNRRI